MHRRRHRSSALTIQKITPLTRLWLLRLLVPLGGHREFVQRIGFSNDALAETLGLGRWIDPEGSTFSAGTVRKELRKLHAAAEREHASAAAPACLRRNIKRLAGLVGLSRADCRILEFSVLIRGEGLLDETADALGALSSVAVFRVLSVLLDLREKEVRAALSPDGALARSALVKLDRDGRSMLRSKLELLSDKFADCVLSTDDDPIGLLRDTVSPAPPPELTLGDYPQVADQLRLLEPYLARAIAGKRKGVGCFLYGAPGTGKTQLTRALATALDCELFEVATEDADGDPLPGEQRLSAYQAAQSFFAKRRALLVFDEAEDVFDDGVRLLGEKSTARTSKGWINKMLEESPVPTLWLSNTVRCLDPAFVRRFDLVFELPVPPRKQRERIVKELCGDLLDEASVTRIASCEALAPAVVARAANVVRSIRDTLVDDEPANAASLLIDGTLEAQGHAPLKRNDPNRLPTFYDAALVNADADLEAIADGLVRAQEGRVCLYGPPGTGKTAYARWLANRLDAPLHVKRASDLLSMWVGGNEQNLSSAFRQAEQDRAVLLIDEVDSFLQDRRAAKRGWEVSMVNEMLTQMEGFSGVFIASTNLMHGIDQAALRRFDLKVLFDFLLPEQAWTLLRHHCAELPEPPPELRSELGRLRNLTPGDFAAVARRNRFEPLRSVQDWIAALAAECALKERRATAIGFV